MSSSIRKKILRWLIRGCLAFCGLFACLLAVIYVFLQRDPEALINRYLSGLEQKTGLVFSAGSLDVSLLPLPAISLGDLRIKGPELDFTVAWLTARPGFIRILSGDFFPGVITILRPRLKLNTELPLSQPEATLQKLNSLRANDPDIRFEIPGSLDLKIIEGQAEATGLDQSNLALYGLGANLEITKNGAIGGNLEFASLRLTQSKTILASLDNFTLAGRTSVTSFFTDTHGLKINGAARYKGVLRSGQFACDFESSSSGWNGQIAINAALDVGGASVPLNLSGRVTRLASGNEIVVRGLDWQLGQDSGSLDLTALVNPGAYSLKGTFLANRLSLTEWMGWARNLCPGLQIALDNVTRCRTEFIVTEKGLTASRIEASCSGSLFTGSGAVPDWKKPVVMLDLATDEANLGLGLPESLAETPDAPWYPHPTLTPMPTDPLKPGETPIGYDIRLKTTNLIYGPVKFQKASLRIHPGKLDKSGFQDVLLEGKATFYNGNVTGSCILGGDPSLPYYITVKADNINGSPLAKAMPILPFRQGQFDASATVTSRGKQLEPFLKNLKGEMKATGENATLAATGSKEIFSQLGATGQLKTASWNGKNLVFDGLWRAHISAKAVKGNCEINGPLVFGSGGMSFKNLSGLLEASLPFGPLPAESKITLKGNFSGNPDEGRFEISRGNLQFAGLNIHGDIKLSTNNNPLSFQGAVKTEIPSLKAELARLSMKKANLPASLDSLKISADISGHPDAIKLNKINAKLGDTAISGSLAWRSENKIGHYDASLVADKLDLAAFTAGSNKTDWNFTELTKFNAKGQIRIKDLIIWDLHFLNANIPFNLANGKLRLDAVTANFYGAPLKCALTADFHKGLSFDSDLACHAFNLANAVKARKIEAILTGSASINAKLNARVAGNEKLASALNGRWDFNIANGSWQSVNKNGSPKGKPTTFNMVSAAGLVRNGVVSSENFNLKGNSLKVNGKGSLNLANQEVNCNFNVDMKGLPDFPVRLYGPLANTKTSIGAGKFVINAMQEVVSGFAGAVGGVLKGAWNMFDRK